MPSPHRSQPSEHAELDAVTPWSVLRFASEVGLVAGAARLPLLISDGADRVPLAAVAGCVAVFVWARFLSPKATHRLTGVPRMALEALLFGGVVVGLLLNASPIFAVVLAVLSLAGQVHALAADRVHRAGLATDATHPEPPAPEADAETR